MRTHIACDSSKWMTLLLSPASLILNVCTLVGLAGRNFRAIPKEKEDEDEDATYLVHTSLFRSLSLSLSLSQSFTLASSTLDSKSVSGSNIFSSWPKAY